jgi:aminopeptidase N
MWLNEAYTVDVERAYLRTVFDPVFLRLREIDAVRAPLGGPLAVEDGGHLGRVVRDGFNHPAELVDGLTYVKAAEAIRMLRLWLGEDAFRAGRWPPEGGTPNAFVADGAPNRGCARSFPVPLEWSAVDAEGRDMPGAGGTLRFDGPRFERSFERTAAGARLGKAVERRFLKGVLMDLLAGLDTPEAHGVLRDHWRQARNVTDRMNALAALWRSGAPDRERLLDGARAWAAPHLAGYLAYLGVVGRSPRPDVFEAVAREERQPEFRLDHPGHTRALYVPLSQNNAQLWTASGLTWLHATVVRLAPVNEATALRLLAACQLVRAMTEPLRGRVLETLAAIRGDLRVETCPSLAGRVEQYLRGPDTGA